MWRTENDYHLTAGFMREDITESLLPFKVPNRNKAPRPTLDFQHILSWISRMSHVHFSHMPSWLSILMRTCDFFTLTLCTLLSTDEAVIKEAASSSQDHMLLTHRSGWSVRAGCGSDESKTPQQHTGKPRGNLFTRFIVPNQQVVIHELRGLLFESFTTLVHMRRTHTRQRISPALITGPLPDLQPVWLTLWMSLWTLNTFKSVV